MRIFEIVLILISLILVLQSFANTKVSRLKYFTPIVASGIFLIHIFYEGIRWQMTSIYLVIFYTIIALLFIIKIQNKIVKWLVLFFCILGIVISSALSYLIPVFSLPKTNGIHKIIAFDKKTENNLGYKIWFPVVQKVDLSKRNTYANSSNNLEGVMGMPSFIFNHLTLVKTNSSYNETVIKSIEKKPLIIYSHGASSSHLDNTALLEEIASFGYVIVAINHKFSFKKYGLDSNEAKKIEVEAQITLINQLIKKAVPNQIIDYKIILQELKNEYPTQINFNNIILIGHSLGGTTACSAALEIKNIKAIVNMDGPIDPKITTNFSLPLLYFSSFSPSLTEKELQNMRVPPNFYKAVKNYELKAVKDLFDNNDNEKYWVRFKNANHLDFTDIPYIIPILSAPNYNSIKGHKLKSQIILSFIDKELNNTNIKLGTKDKSLEWIKQSAYN